RPAVPGGPAVSDAAVAPYLLRYRERMARRGERDGRGAPLSQRQLRTNPDGRFVATRSPEIVAEPLPDLAEAGAVELHLVRHGETQSYLADAGLTPRGIWQSRRLGHALAAEVADGEAVRLLCAPTHRAARTADQLRLGLEDGLAAC